MKTNEGFLLLMMIMIMIMIMIQYRYGSVNVVNVLDSMEDPEAITPTMRPLTTNRLLERY